MLSQRSIAAWYAAAASASRPQPAQQVGAHRVKQVVTGQVECIHQSQRLFRAFDFGNHHRAIQRDHGARRQREQLVVEREDLPPVCLRRRCARRCARR